MVVRTGSSSITTATSDPAITRTCHDGRRPSTRKLSMITRYSATMIPALHTIRAAENDISANGMKKGMEIGAYV